MEAGHIGASVTIIYNFQAVRRTDWVFRHQPHKAIYKLTGVGVSEAFFLFPPFSCYLSFTDFQPEENRKREGNTETEKRGARCEREKKDTKGSMAKEKATDRERE